MMQEGEKMRKYNILINIITITLCLLILFSCTASAKQLTVTKVIPNTDIKTGDSISISLEFDNPFNRSIPLTIQDNNILGSSGLEIQCYEYTLPDKPHSGISYDFPTIAYSSGDFTLDPATVTYNNPETGAQESVRSEPVKINIKQGQTAGQQQGITKIYNCGGVSMQSTSISSSSSTSISISSGNQQTGQNSQQPLSSPGDIQQEAQDMQNLKKEMERQQQEQQRSQQELKEKIENNSEFKNLKEKLEKQGYTPEGQNIQPESNDTGNFDYNFKKGEESANISGRINAGKMENIQEQSTEDIKRLMQEIERNETFREMYRTLYDKGFNLFSRNVDIKQNISSFEYLFSNSQGKNASITGNVTDAGEIKDIRLKEPEPAYQYWIPAVLILMLGIYIFLKSWLKEKPAVLKIENTSFDPEQKALSMLENAISMFNNGREKEAFMEASNAVRYFFKGTAGIHELTSNEIIRSIKGSKNEGHLQDVKDCFMLCDRVKFAKFEPNRQDFDIVVEYAKRIIGP
ncbi:MAG: hypothetical protein OIN87_09870 [Candidatus Methanoperedens sp.]|nr:hypothetical protein [Candidatus Methanoperedens sp.]